LVSREQALKMDFGEALNVCKEKKVILSKTAALSSVVKGYRNLIHPGRLIRLNETISNTPTDANLHLL